MIQYRRYCTISLVSMICDNIFIPVNLFSYFNFCLVRNIISDFMVNP